MQRWFVIMGLCFFASYINISAQESNNERITSRNERPYPRYIDCSYITFSKEEYDLLNEKQKYISLPFKIHGDTILSLIDNYVLNKISSKKNYKDDSVTSIGRATHDAEFIRRFGPIGENISLLEIIKKINSDQDSNFIVLYLQEKDFETYLSRLQKVILYFRNNSDYINGKVEKALCLNKSHAMVNPDDDKMFCELILAELATSSIADQYKINANVSDLIKAKEILVDYYLSNGDFEYAEQYLISELNTLSECNYENKKDDQLILFKKISDIFEKQGKTEIAKKFFEEDKDFSIKKYFEIKQSSFQSEIRNRGIIPQSPPNPQQNP